MSEQHKSVIRKDNFIWLLVSMVLICCPLANAHCQQGYKKRGENCCLPQKCQIDYRFRFCNGTGLDICDKCPNGTINPQEVDTGDFDYPLELCHKPDCSCTPEAVLINKDECMKSGIKICQCDRANGNFGPDPIICQQANSSVRMQAHHPGYELTDSGRVQQCKQGFFKSASDGSICKEKRICPYGSRVISEGDISHDRVCEEVFTLSTDPSVTLTSTTPGSSDNSTEGHINEHDEMLYGIIGGVACVGIAVIIAVCCYCYKRSRQREDAYTAMVPANGHQTQCSPVLNGSTSNISMNGHLQTPSSQQTHISSDYTIIEMQDFPTSKGTVSPQEQHTGTLEHQSFSSDVSVNMPTSNGSNPAQCNNSGTTSMVTLSGHQTDSKDNQEEKQNSHGSLPQRKSKSTHTVSFSDTKATRVKNIPRPRNEYEHEKMQKADISRKPRTACNSNIPVEEPALTTQHEFHPIPPQSHHSLGSLHSDGTYQPLTVDSFDSNQDSYIASHSCQEPPGQEARESCFAPPNICNDDLLSSLKKSKEDTTSQLKANKAVVRKPPAGRAQSSGESPGEESIESCSAPVNISSGDLPSSLINSNEDTASQTKADVSTTSQSMANKVVVRKPPVGRALPIINRPEPSDVHVAQPTQDDQGRFCPSGAQREHSEHDDD